MNYVLDVTFQTLILFDWNVDDYWSTTNFSVALT